MNDFTMDTSHFPGVSRTETPVARPPSPPYIHIPTTLDADNSIILQPITAANPSPIFDLGSGTTITRQEVELITQSLPQTSPRGQDWSYESRRRAQPILTYLYLGPASITRDAALLRSHGITMLLAARDTRQAAARLLGVSKCAAELGIASDTVDVSGRAELISAIPLAVSKINSHLLSLPPGVGKVLVCCETGNERSAALVAAYIMTMYDADLVRTLQFVHYKRFCANFDDDIKFLLRSYGDIVAARRMVNHFPPAQQQQQLLQESAVRHNSGELSEKRGKRGIDDSRMDDDEEREKWGPVGGSSDDVARFSGRHITPFVDSGGDAAMGLQG